MIKTYTFNSGLRLIVSENHSIRSVSFGIFVNNGVVNEDETNNGISHLIEHMLFKGTKNRTAFDIVNETDSIGAIINAYTSRNNTCFYVKTIDEHLEKCVDILSDMYFNSTFDEKELKREKGVVCEEINESLDDPNDVCNTIASSKFFEGHVYEKEILGSKKTVKAITREQIIEYYKENYNLSNTVISIAGNITFEDALIIVEKYFESYKTENSLPSLQFVDSHNPKKAFVKKKKDVEQTQLVLMFQCYDFDDKRKNIANIISTMFVNEMSSRLFQIIREKLGLCYGIGGGPTSTVGAGCFLIELSTTPSKAEMALKAIKSEICKIKKHGFTASELQRAKEITKAGLVFGQESSSSVMKLNGIYYLRGNIFNPDEAIDYFNSITLEDVSIVFDYIFDFNHMVLAAVGPNIKSNLLEIFNP